MSLSDGQNYAQNWFATGGGVPEQITNLIGQLAAMNIPVVAATGNSFNGQQGEGFAAIVARARSASRRPTCPATSCPTPSGSAPSVGGARRP